MSPATTGCVRIPEGRPRRTNAPAECEIDLAAKIGEKYKWLVDQVGELPKKFKPVPNTGAVEPPPPDAGQDINMKQRLTRVCIFCGGQAAEENPITGEHLWSDWMADYLPSDPGARRIEFQEDLKSEDSQEPIKIESDRLGAANMKRIRVVCRKCNNEWMSRLETPSKAVLAPLMIGKDVLLDEGSIAQLMKFVSMKMMVAEHDAFHGRSPMPIYDDDDRTRFMAEPYIPLGVRAWLAPAGGPKWRTGFYRYVSGVYLTPTLAAGTVVAPHFKRRGANIHSVTWGIGQFVVHLIATTHVKFYSAVAWDAPPGLVPIWPYDGRLMEWRPNFRLTDWAIDDIAHSFRREAMKFPRIKSDGTLYPPA